MTYLLACNLVVQHIISCNWVLPVGNIFIIIIIIIINPLTNLLNSTGYGFNIRLNNTTLSKLNHLLYMDDIKLYASKKNHILSLLTITENFSNDIGMSFGIDNFKMVQN
jgi:hypothetical protein